eukprot:3731063-Amphidinium_carterae.1
MDTTAQPRPLHLLNYFTAAEPPSIPLFTVTPIQPFTTSQHLHHVEGCTKEQLVLIVHIHFLPQPPFRTSPLSTLGRHDLLFTWCLGLRD